MTDQDKQELRQVLEQELLDILKEANFRSKGIRNDPNNIGEQTLQALAETIRARRAARESPPPSRKRGQPLP